MKLVRNKGHYQVSEISLEVLGEQEQQPNYTALKLRESSQIQEDQPSSYYIQYSEVQSLVTNIAAASPALNKGIPIR